jgi:hypothetical protein
MIPLQAHDINDSEGLQTDINSDTRMADQAAADVAKRTPVGPARTQDRLHGKQTLSRPCDRFIPAYRRHQRLCRARDCLRFHRSSLEFWHRIGTETRGELCVVPMHRMPRVRPPAVSSAPRTNRGPESASATASVSSCAGVPQSRRRCRCAAIARIHADLRWPRHDAIWVDLSAIQGEVHRPFEERCQRSGSISLARWACSSAAVRSSVAACARRSASSASRRALAACVSASA